MSGDEPRRSGRSTKGQHNKLDSPGPASKAGKTVSKKSKKNAGTPQSDGEEDDAEVIRCICGNDDPGDKRAFIGCDACSAWQHNVCMGMPDDEDEVGEHYFCEQCRPEEHGETLEALARGDKIWETRNKIYSNDKKRGKSRKSKGGERPAWLKSELRGSEAASETPIESKDNSNGNKRKRGIKEETEEAEEDDKKVIAAEKPTRAPRQDKRRKAEPAIKQDPDTALVELDQLPVDRQRVARALNSLLADDIQDRITSGSFKPSKDQTAQTLAEHHALRVEYALHINHNGPTGPGYVPQFRTLNANLKKNKTLVQGLLAGHLTADELSTMSSSDMASEELQQERAAMKAESDRQAVIDVRDDGPRYRRTHKGDEIVEAEAAASSSAPTARPVRPSVSEADGVANGTAGSPVQDNAGNNDDRKASKEAFDMKGIWAKADTGEARPLQMPARRRSSIQPASTNGTKVDADVDRLLADDDDGDVYSPKDYPSDIVWRGKIVQSIGDLEPTINARWVAGRDVSQTIAWTELLADKLNIDGRLSIPKAEEYLCGLQWSKTSDVSVLALTPYDDASAFEKVFDYFKSRDRYAVVNKDKPALLVKDLYIIPVDIGDKLPEHIDMLEHCTIKKPVEEKLLLATFVVSRAPVDLPLKEQTAVTGVLETHNGHQQAQIQAQSMQGPAASPINSSAPQFAPQYNGGSPQAYTASYSVPSNPPYPVSQQAGSTQFPSAIQPAILQMATEILGDLAHSEVAKQILSTPTVSRDQIVNMRRIFDEDVATRTDFNAFVNRLMAP